MFALGGEGAAPGGGSQRYPDWLASQRSWLAQHEAALEAGIAAAGVADFEGLAIFDYENWFLTWNTQGQESFYAPFASAFSDFVTANNFPDFNATMMSMVGWTPPAGTRGWGDLTPAEQTEATGAVWDWAVQVYLNATMRTVKAHAPKARWGFFAYPWFRSPRATAAMRGSNDRLAWLWRQVDVLVPAYYPSFWATSDPAKAPCPMTNTPAQDKAVYAANCAEMLRVRDTHNPHAMVVPYVGWYNLCGSTAPCSPVNVEDQVTLSANLGLDGVVLFGALDNVLFKTPAQLATYLNTQWGPAIMGAVGSCSS